jgi:Uma2 family endonuclease
MTTDAKTPKGKRKISLESFWQQYASRKDAYKYEWKNGIVEKTPRTMNRDQSKIQNFLLRTFFQRNIAGALIVELDMFLPKSKRTRRADIGYLTPNQLEASDNGDQSPSEFVIEVISSNDKINDAETKLYEYFDSGVKVVWQILPTMQLVKVYTSPKNIVICSDNDICSALPVLNDFQIPAKAIFQ